MPLLLQADRYPLETPEEVPQDAGTQLYFRTCLESRRREGKWGGGMLLGLFVHLPYSWSKQIRPVTPALSKPWIEIS